MKQQSKAIRKDSSALEHASIGMAVVDALPVLFFSMSIWLIHLLFPSVWFSLGAVLCILAGLGKVMWKLVLAISGKVVVWLNKQFRVLMPAGFTLILVSLFADGGKINWNKVWQSMTIKPVSVLLILGLLLMGMMFVLAAKMDQSSAKANWMEQCVNLCAQLFILLAVCVMWYNAQAHMGSDGVDAWLTDHDGVRVTKLEDGYCFDGPGTEAAMVFYPGGQVSSEAYAPLLFMLAERGLDTFVLDMPLYTAFLDENAAERIIDQGSYQYQTWLVGGHSLGGLAASDYAAKHPQKVKGLVLMAAYPNKTITDERIKILSVRGSRDAVLNENRYQKAMTELDGNYTEVVIEGGNHGQFGYYGMQPGDKEATISYEEQWQQTVDAVFKVLMGD